MQLIKLIVLKNNIILREIKFNEGISFITCAEEDGNQIGKSTMLRVLNFCFGSEGNSIWIDPETKQTNKEIKELVTTGGIAFELSIKVNNIPHIIKRRFEAFGKRKVMLKRLSSINESEHNTNEKFQKAIADLIGLPYKSPSFSQIKNRLFRLKKTTASNAFEYDDKYTSSKDYTFLYSYIFGFDGIDDLAKELVISKDIKSRADRISMLLNNKDEQSYKEKIESINIEIESLKNQESTFDFKDTQNKTLKKLKKIREEISEFSSEISKLDIKIHYTRKTINSYKSDISKINTTEIEKIYEEAKSIIPNISKTLQETIAFHNDSLNKKTTYLENNLKSYEEKEAKLGSDLNLLLDREKEVISELSNESGLAGFFMIEKELQDKYEEKGRASAIIEEVKIENNEIINLNSQVVELRKNNEINLAKLEHNLNLFNKHFRKITKKVFHNIELKLDAKIDSATKELNYSIINFDKISGDGSPRAVSLAFDMALIEYTKEMKLHRPIFTVQDYLESMDEDKLATLSKFANEHKIQVVASVLKHTLQSLSDDFIQKNTVLWLSKSDKFFKLP